MTTLKEQFEQAAVDAKNLKSRPDNDTLLRMYALYKQGAEGDVSGPPPGMFDFVASAKFQAWSKLEGSSQESAMKKYIDLIKSLKS
jgi:acyl-CoA-binding protein